MPVDTVRKGVALWPGVVGESHATYTLSHGITPGCILMTINPQPLGSFATEGDMVFEDGVSRIVLPDCKVLSLKRRGDTQQGFVDTIEILDHRWRWNLGAINGTYNLLDDNKKLIGWSIRSPTELAILCLRQMGETNYDIDLPPGISSTAGALAFQLQPPWMGVVPVVGTNPPIDWQGEIPAQALAQLCDMFGRRVVWQWSTGKVLIAVPGRGNSLPPGSIASESPSIRNSMRPSGVGVLGAPTRYQSRLLMEPVGEDWFGGIVPIDQLTYAPLLPPLPQIVAFQGENFDLADPLLAPPDGTYSVGIGRQGVDPFTNPEPHVDINSAVFSVTVAGAISWSAVVNDLAVAINASAWGALVEATPQTTLGIIRLTITSKSNDPDYHYFSWGTLLRVLPIADVLWNAFLFQVGLEERPGWDLVPPPSGFTYGVRPTPGRLTRIEAAQLAMKTVWRMFRIKANSDGSYPIVVPGYGPISRRQQIVLEDTKVEQITPARDFVRERILTRETEQELSLNFYNGYSHNKPLAVFGEVTKQRGDILLWPGAGRTPGNNSDRNQQLLLSFSVDPVQQTIYCNSRYCFKVENGKHLDPKLVLETGYTLRNAISNSFEQLVATLPIPQYADLSPITLVNVSGRTQTGQEGLNHPNVATRAIVFNQAVPVPTPRSSPTAYQWRTYSDIQVGVIGQYSFGPERVKIVEFSGTNVLEPDGVYTIGLAVQGVDPLTAPGGTESSETFVYTTSLADTFDEIADSLVADINGDPVWQNRVTASKLDGTDNKWIRVVGKINQPDIVLFYNAATAPNPTGGTSPGVNTWTVATVQEPRVAFSSEELQGFNYLEADPFMRARYYLAGMAAQYIDELGLTQQYNGLEPIDVDGAIQQITWEVDSQGGCSTIASVNNEHNIWVPPYPARRRAEFLQGYLRNDTGTRDIGRNFYAATPGVPPIPRVT